VTRAARVAALVAVLLASTLSFAAAAPTAPTAPTGTAAHDAIELISQDPWTPVGGDLRIGLRVAPSIADDPDATVRITAADALASRSDFDRVIADGVSGSPIDETEVPLASLAADATGTRVLTLGLESAQQRDQDRFGLREPGVYPLVVRIEAAEAADARGSEFTTFAVVSEATADGAARPLASPLGVAWVWPLREGPSTLPDGSVDPTVLDSFGADGRLGRQAAALARAGDVHLTLVPGAETLEAWVAAGREDPAAAQGAAAVLDAASRSEVLSTTYVPSDLPSLLRAGLERVVDRQLVHGRAVLDELLAAPPTTTTVLVRPANDAALARLKAGAVERVIVDSAALDSDEVGNPTITQPFQLRPDGNASGSLAAVASDSGLVALLAGRESPALRAQRLLAGLSIVALEAPSALRSVVLATQSELTAPSALFDTVLAGLRGNPWLESMTVSSAFSRVPSGSSRSPEVRTLAPMPVPSPPVAAIPYRLTEARVDAFTEFAGTDDPIVTEARRALLIAESSTFAGSEGLARASATLDRVNQTMDAFLASIRIPDPGTITLTSRSGEIPLTFRNDTGRRVRIVVTVESPKLFFPDGSTQTIDLAPRSTTLRLAVEARTSGNFPLQLSVRTAAGDLVIAESRFQVRSTVVSAVGLTLMIGAAVFLAVWWGLYIWRARRRRRTGVPAGG